MIVSCFENLTLGACAYLSSEDLYPTGTNTQDARLWSDSFNISSHFAGSNHSIGHASIPKTAALANNTPCAIYTCLVSHSRSESSDLPSKNPSTIFL